MQVQLNIKMQQNILIFSTLGLCYNLLHSFSNESIPILYHSKVRCCYREVQGGSTSTRSTSTPQHTFYISQGVAFLANPHKSSHVAEFPGMKIDVRE